MKRIATIVVLLGLVIGCQAQMLYQRHVEIAAPLATDSTDVDSTETCMGQGHDRIDLMLGLSAGVNLFTNDNQWSPYYSKQGLVLQVPLLFRYQVSPHWRLSTGLQVNLNYNPLHYNVDYYSTTDENGNLGPVEGLDFGNYASTRTEGKQYAYTFFGYLGIPLQVTWNPWHEERRLLGVSADLFAGYAFVTNIGFNASYAERRAGNVSVSEIERVNHHAESLMPWKLELGVTLSTGVIGLLHGVRFFVNLLPSYREPVTGDGIYLHGMTLYL